MTMTAQTARRPMMAALIAALALLALLGGAHGADGEVVARIGGIDVSAEDVRAYVRSLDPRDQAAVERDPASLSQAVRALLASQVVLKEALAQKWDQQPAVATQLQRLRDSALTELFLQSVSKPPEAYPSQTELESAYEENKASFVVPRQFHLAQIFVAAPKSADKALDEKARTKVAEIQRKLKQKGADFGAIAQADSEDPETAKRRGEIALLAENQIAPEIRTVVMGLAKDAISDPQRLDDGWHIVKLLDTKAAYTPSLAELHDQLALRLRAERAAANRRAYLAKLLEHTPPAINELALAKVLAKSEK